MTDNFWTALFVGLPGIIAAITAAYIAIKQAKMTNDIKSIHDATNSMKDELVKVTGESEKAKGKLEGAAEERMKK